MQLYIPRVGAHLCLTSPWTFTLHYENRNSKFYNEVVPRKDKKIDDVTSLAAVNHKPEEVTLAKGIVLKVDRLYVRKVNGSGEGMTGNASSYDSITFVIEKGPKNLKKKRFWVKLDDANKIEFTHHIQMKFTPIENVIDINGFYPDYLAHSLALPRPFVKTHKTVLGQQVRCYTGLEFRFWIWENLYEGWRVYVSNKKGICFEVDKKFTALEAINVWDAYVSLFEQYNLYHSSKSGRHSSI